jgi:hypothetical protein
MLKVICKTAEHFTDIAVSYETFLIKVQSSNSLAVSNMGHNGPSGLVYLAHADRGPWRRWSENCGELAFLVDDVTEEIVGVSAVENSTLSPDLGSGGNRCWLLPEYRKNNEVTQYLLASNLNWCKKHNKKGMVLSFNDYNKWIYDTIAKRTTGKGSALGKVWSNWWNDCLLLPRQITLQNAKQWAVIKPLANIDSLFDIINYVDREFGND